MFSDIKMMTTLPKRETLGEEFTDEDYETLCNKLIIQNEQVNISRKRLSFLVFSFEIIKSGTLNPK